MAKNLKPEKIVEQQVKVRAWQLGLDVDVIESKATFSRNLGIYLRGNAPSGFPDMVGSDREGKAVYIELKTSKNYVISEEQKAFLLNKIEKFNSFAVVVRSPEELEKYYLDWKSGILSQEGLASLVRDIRVKSRSSRK